MKIEKKKCTCLSSLNNNSNNARTMFYLSWFGQNLNRDKYW